MENQNVAANAAQNAAMQQVVNNNVVAPKSLLEIAQMGSKDEGFKLQCEKFGKILTDTDLTDLEKKVNKRLESLKTYQSNLENLLVEIHQKQAAERFEELKAIYADLSPEQKAALAS